VVATKVELPKDQNDDIEMEEAIHDLDKIMSMTVIEHELTVLQDIIKKSKGDEKDFFKEKFDNLEFSKTTIESNVKMEFVTPEKYLATIKLNLKDQ